MIPSVVSEPLAPVQSELIFSKVVGNSLSLNRPRPKLPSTAMVLWSDLLTTWTVEDFFIHLGYARLHFDQEQNECRSALKSEY